MNEKIAFVSLGCDKNTVDSEIMLGKLLDAGYEITKEEAEADVMIVNTCGFINDAKEESIQMLIELGRYKETGKLKALIAAGCLAQRYPDEIRADLPEVDGIVGTGSYEEIAEIVSAALRRNEKDRPAMSLADPSERALAYQRRIFITPNHYGFLKIAEGCDNHCTYCIIPQLRGKFRARDEADLLREAKELAENGCRELIVVAQDITKYPQLPQLLKRLCAVDGIAWIRLLYAYPEDITDELIATIASEPKIVHYLDIPIQHCSDTVLKRMGRHHTKAMLEEVIAKLRKAMPDIALRTTLITGFPGETEAQFEEMKTFIEAARFDRLGVFTYSQEENTPAAALPDQIPEDVKERRKDALMQAQQRVSAQLSESRVGRTLDVLIDGEIPDAAEGVHIYETRTYRDAPEIDGFLFLSTTVPHASGDIVTARVTGAYEYDLVGEEYVEPLK